MKEERNGLARVEASSTKDFGWRLMGLNDSRIVFGCVVSVQESLSTASGVKSGSLKARTTSRLKARMTSVSSESAYVLVTARLGQNLCLAPTSSSSNTTTHRRFLSTKSLPIFISYSAAVFPGNGASKSPKISSTTLASRATASASGSPKKWLNSTMTTSLGLSTKNTLISSKISSTACPSSA